MLRTALRALAERFGGPPELNLWVRSAPRGSEHFHWHIDIAPRLTIRAGFELGTGVDIDIYPPERAAAPARSAWSIGSSGAAQPAPDPALYRRLDAGGDSSGRFAERLSEVFAKACAELEDLPDATAVPTAVDWFPERAWGGRVWVPLSARAESAEHPGAVRSSLLCTASWR